MVFSLPIFILILLLEIHIGGVVRVANYFYVTYDTIGPATPSILIENGALFASSQLVNCTISVGDTVTTGYQVKIWGDVDTSYDANVQTTEGASTYFAYTSTKQVNLSAGNGTKRLYLKVRDDVYNESGQAQATVNLDSSKPIVSITGPDNSKISKIAGRDTCSVTFTCDKIFTDYVVKFVSSISSPHTTGTVIPTTNGSTNTSGSNVSGFAAGTPIGVSIKGADLELASAGDGQKLIKIFTKDQAGNWSA